MSGAYQALYLGAYDETLSKKKDNSHRQSRTEYVAPSNEPIESLGFA